VGVADCNELLSYNWNIDTEARHEKAKSMIVKALGLDRDLAEAHTTRGLALLHDWNLRESEMEFLRAIELKPSYATAHQWYYHLLLPELRWGEALAQIEKALELDPLSVIINLNHAQYYSSKRDHVRAIDLYKKTLELDANFPLGHFELAGSYGKLKMFEEMKREINIGLGLVQDTFPHVAKMTNLMIAQLEDNKDEVRKMTPALEEYVGKVLGATPLLIAGLYFFIDEKERGFEWLEKAYATRDSNLLRIQVDDSFDCIRNEPRYLDLLKRIGLTGSS
jgi:tetratricopeptide (TPR) repeat protein